MYILCFDFKNTTENQEFHFLTEICEIRNKRLNSKSFTQIVCDFFSLLRYLKENKLFKLCNLLKNYRNVYIKSSAKRECHDENVFLKADRVLNK